MSSEITTEVLAKAIDTTKETVQTDTNKVKLNIQGKNVDYQILNKAASDEDSQLNAMAIAPIVNGKPDYNNVAVVYAGTNMYSDTGANGFVTAGGALTGGLSGEYEGAQAFLNETQDKIAKHNGSITDVAGFSQSGGYMMKMAGECGKEMGFQTTSFDDWGRDQFGTLTDDQLKWLKSNPEMLRRYQNDSWANFSGRDHTYGTVSRIEGIGFNEHNTLAKYFDGDTLNLDRLAKDGIFAPGMTKAQVELAAKNWAKKNGDGKFWTGDDEEAKARVKEYLKLYGSYRIADLSELKKLRKKLKSSGGGLSKNEEIYLDNSEALLVVTTASQTMKDGLIDVITIYQEAITEAKEVWVEGLQHARSIGTELNESEIIDALAAVGATEASIVTEPIIFYKEQITKAIQLGESFDSLVSEIKSGIDKLVQSDKNLASQLF
ncbi:hypothetical protein A5821_001119 [Enterococcus sp. 7F3_DIV0205]|uniref:Uncharacterized protein n=1 Tax=Candidatus Enterococcus palustris TaxID=1834189 RepID=A0AAQ3Y720_9ENTE|nr:hypothetical protein [Enterococcus sp. 7F3_DIV0205]OTN85516.1 hypothetical protein A5821_001462 [Enterococcus sp. 7F3_DIV0205]